MEEDKDIKSWFEIEDGSFDYQEPKSGHRTRFLEKLQLEEQGGREKIHPPNKSGWKRWSVAASVSILLGIGAYFFNNQKASASWEDPQLTQSEQYFSGVIATQLEQLKKERTPQTQKIIEDTFTQLQVLETDYNKLTIQLQEGAEAKLIIAAMIQNFQTRLQLLEDVMKQINDVKAQKQENYEDNII
ncbi:MAG: hypothetical protein OIF50_13810 [Flavobacteriaceae bacterium]|nr:hypothetical protein [Flavobacteriaceae bacterium]